VSTYSDAEPVFTKADYEMFATLRYTLRRFLRFSELTALAHGITPQQYQALQAIQGFPGRDWVTMNELAERLQIQSHSAVGLVNRLAKKELVTRQATPSNRRQVQVRLTPAGRALLDRLMTAHLAEWRQLAPRMQEALLRFARMETRGE